MYALVWILRAAIAASGAPVVSVDAQGVLHATALVAMPAAELQARMSDPSWIQQFDATGTAVRRRQPDGACEFIDYHTPSSIRSVDFTVRQCPIPNGYQATLVRSSLFTRYESRWTFVPEDGRARVDYVLDVGMPAAFRVFAGGKMASSVRSMLERLMAWADGRHDTREGRG